MSEKTNTGLYRVATCVAYIESCGFTFNGRFAGSYWFTKDAGVMPSGSNKVGFSLSELRHAMRCGW